MNLDLMIEIWEVLHPHIAGNHQSAADDFVQLLVEHGIDAEDISASTSDVEIKKSLLEYIEIDAEEFEDDDLALDFED